MIEGSSRSDGGSIVTWVLSFWNGWTSSVRYQTIDGHDFTILARVFVSKFWMVFLVVGARIVKGALYALSALTFVSISDIVARFNGGTLMDDFDAVMEDANVGWRSIEKYFLDASIVSLWPIFLANNFFLSNDTGNGSIDDVVVILIDLYVKGLLVYVFKLRFLLESRMPPLPAFLTRVKRAWSFAPCLGRSVKLNIYRRLVLSLSFCEVNINQIISK